MQHPISRQALALLLIAFVLALTPLAYETPLTPPWQGGFFDDGNVDDVVGFVISITVLVEGRPVCCLRPLPRSSFLRTGPSSIRFRSLRRPRPIPARRRPASSFQLVSSR